jgi:hypothetical protein
MHRIAILSLKSGAIARTIIETRAYVEETSQGAERSSNNPDLGFMSLVPRRNQDFEPGYAG